MLQVVSEALVNEWVGLDALCIAVAMLLGAVALRMVPHLDKRGRRLLVKLLRAVLRARK